MQGKRIKQTIAILLYAAFLITIFITGTLYYQNQSLQTMKDQFDHYEVRQDTVLTQPQADNPIRFDDVIQSFRFSFSTFQISFFIVLFTTALIATYFLWFYLHNLNKKEVKEIILNLESIEEAISIPDNDLKKVYQRLQERFESYLNDYKRLNYYLSHEQKNAIATLRMRLEVDHQTQYLSQLDNITDCINDILTLGEHNDEATNVIDVALICAEVYDAYSKSYPLLKFTLEEEDHTEILGKKRWIQRAISNLVDNAIKYGNGKSIEISIKNKRGSVIVMVEDHGVGIPASEKEQIFNMNYRIRKLKSDGYGIGLSLVNHVCDLCHGYAYLESEIGKGTKFYLSFPAYKEINELPNNTNKS